MERIQAEQPETHAGEAVSVLLLWAGAGLGPLAWFLNHLGGFALAPLACTTSAKWFLWLLAAATLSLTVVAAAISIRCWRMVRDAPDPALPSLASHPDPCNQRAMAIAGIALSSLSFLAIVAQVIPTLILGGCE
jgi:hypothetical protein